MRKRFLFALFLAICPGYATETAFVVNYANGSIYSFNPNSPSTAATLRISGLAQAYGLAMTSDGATVYVTTYTRGGDVYSFPSAGPYTATALGLGTEGSLQGIALSSDQSLGLTVTDQGGFLYSFPTAGSSHTATTLTATGPTISSPSAIAISGSSAYVGGTSSDRLYTFPVNSSNYNASMIQNDVGISAIGASSNGYLYYAVSTGDTGAVYRVPLASPTDSPVKVANSVSETSPTGLAVSSDGTTVFLGISDAGVYSFVTNSSFPQTPTLLNGLGLASAAGIVIGNVTFSTATNRQIPLAGLTGNNLTFATYLNQNAPQSTIALISTLPGANRAAALKAAAPMRNALPVFAAGNALFLTTQAVTDHLQQRRLSRSSNTSNTPLKELGAFVAQTTDTTIELTPKEDGWVQPGHYSIWAEVVGDYAHEKAQHQTPAFSVRTGGVIGALDGYWSDQTSLGGGLGYLYSDLREERGAGNGSINQGVAMLYWEYAHSHFYIDLGAWGGYYHINHERHIAFSGVDAKARSSPHGWQCLPHLEMGGKATWASFELAPFAMLDWANSWEMKFTEHGTSPFNVSQNKHYSSMLRSEAGLRFYEKINRSWGSLTFLEKVSYVNKALFQTGSVTAVLVGSPGSFTLETLTGSQNLGLAQFEIVLHPAEEHVPKIALSYQGELSTSYQSHQLAIRLEKRLY